MNTDNEPPAIPRPVPDPPCFTPVTLPPRASPHALGPMENGTGVGSAAASLLKRPGAILYELINGTHAARVAVSLTVITIAGLLLFGAITGSISHGPWWAAPLKITGGVIFTSLLCLPSLYIFAALSGMALNAKVVTGILLSTTGLTALLLAGFTPLVWVFGESTRSIVFVGTLLVIVWCLSLLFGMNLLFKSSRAFGSTDRIYLGIWCLMFLLVSLQVSCRLRPIVGRSGTLLTSEKKFFLEHWIDNLDQPRNPDQPVEIRVVDSPAATTSPSGVPALSAR